MRTTSLTLSWPSSRAFDGSSDTPRSKYRLCRRQALLALHDTQVYCTDGELCSTSWCAGADNTVCCIACTRPTSPLRWSVNSFLRWTFRHAADQAGAEEVAKLTVLFGSAEHRCLGSLDRWGEETDLLMLGSSPLWTCSVSNPSAPFVNIILERARLRCPSCASRRAVEQSLTRMALGKPVWRRAAPPTSIHVTRRRTSTRHAVVRHMVQGVSRLSGACQTCDRRRTRRAQLVLARAWS